MAGSPGIRPTPDPPEGPRAALVIATTSYQDPELRQLRAPAHDAQDLAEVLADPGIGAFNVTSVIDADEWQARRAIDAFLSGRGVGDLVVVYVSCHGVLDRRNRLYFAAADTVKTQLSSTGIPSAWLLDQLEDCRARRQVLILDCCFSGAFAHGSKGDADLDLERRLAVPGRGQAVLTASRAGEYSFEGQALPGTEVSGSVFTAGLVEGLRTGAADAGGDGYVSVDEAYDYAYRYVQSSGASQTPQRWLSGGEGAIVLARSPAGMTITPAPLPEDLAATLDSRYSGVRIGAVHELGGWLTGRDPARAITAEQKLRQIADTDNPAVAAAARAYLASSDQPTALIGSHVHSVQEDENAAVPVAEKAPERVRSAQARADRLLAEAERIAQSITDPSAKAWVLRDVALAVAPTDPDRARRIAQSITESEANALALRGVAQAVAPTDPDRAQSIAQWITDLQDKEFTVGAVAKAVAVTDPDRAERIAQSITDERRKELALRGVAQAVAVTDPDRAERVAQSITTQTWKAEALSKVALAVAATDPDRAARLLANAERLVQSENHQSLRDSALYVVAPAVAATDPDRAPRIAQSITDENKRASALRDVALAVAATDPDRAERIAQSITDENERVSALRGVTEAVGATDPDLAERIAEWITDPSAKAWAVGSVAKATAATDPDRAERIAQSITDPEAKASVLSAVVEAVAGTDPDRAERIAQSITDPGWKVRSLLKIVKV
jgi:uridine phosphorylase